MTIWSGPHRPLLTHRLLLFARSPSRDVPPFDDPSSIDEFSSLTASPSIGADAQPPLALGLHACLLLVVDCYVFSGAALLEPTSYCDVVHPELKHVMVEEIPD